MRIFFACLVLGLGFGCASDPGPVHMTEVECRLNSDCEVGSYCDPFANLCGWDCRADTECELGMFCDVRNGSCLREEMPPIESPVLEIVTGDLTDTVVMSGTSDTELLRFDVVNHGDRDTVLRLLPVGFVHEDGTPAEHGSFTDVKFVDRADLYTLMGPQDLRPEVGANLYFDDEITLPAGETTTLVLRVDIGGSGRYRVTVGTLVALLEDVVYADTLERIPADRIRDNRILGRVVEVFAAPTAGTSALVGTFIPSGGLLYHASALWQRLGGVEFAAYGSDATISRVRVGGRSVRLVSGYTIARDGVIIGNDAPPHSAGDFADILLSEPLLVRDGEHVIVDVWGRIPGADLIGELTVNLYEVEAVRSDAGSLEIVRTGRDSEFRVWRNYPVVVPQVVSTTTLANGFIPQELYKLQLSPASTSGTVYIGSLTFRFVGLGDGRSLRNIRVRRGSVELAPSSYVILRTGERASLDPEDRIDGLSSQITIWFPDGLPISGFVDVLTVLGIPDGFATGETLDIFFGDRIFSGTYNGFWGHLTSDGQIDEFDGLHHTVASDPIVWSDGNPYALYTGAWMITDLEPVVRLTAR